MTAPPDDPEAARTLAVGQTFAGSYHVEEEAGDELGHVFFGRDQTTGKPLVFVRITAERESTLRPLVTLDHAHLVPLLALEPIADDHFVAIAAVMEGETLAERLEAVGKKPSVDAVRMALRLADALATIHEIGGVHGWVSPHAVIVEPTEGVRPQLALGVRPDQALHTPERAPDGLPSIADDTWATAALLHWMLTGGAPPEDGYASAEELEAAGVADAALRAALFPALTASRPDRQTDLRPLRRELARWFVEHAAEEPILPGHHMTAPPPLPPSIRPQTRVSAHKSLPPIPKRRLGAFATAAIALGVGAGVALTALRPKRVEVVPVPEKAPAPTASALELGEVPVTGEDDVHLGSKLAACLAEYLPKGTFGKTPDVDWLCSETDPRQGAEKLHVAIVASAPKGTVTDAMKIFARIGWYALPAFAVVRAGCCTDAKPLELPGQQCDMTGALHDVGETVVSERDVTEPLQKYTDSIHCELNHGGAKLFHRAERPVGGEDTAFLELVKHIE